MKIKIRIKIKSMSYLLIVLMIFCWGGNTTVPTEQKIKREQIELFCEEVIEERESITFILGEDKKASNPYYAEAKKFYSHNAEARTEYLVDSCRSLWSVRNYLYQNPPANGLPWGRVNLVLHSNEWNGLGVAILPGGRRASNAGILATILQGDFTPLPNALLDEQSEMVFYGCAMGKNKKILPTLSRAFGGLDQAPKVASSKYFIYYESEMYNGMPVNCQRYLTDYYYAFYKTGYRPGDIRLSRQLAKRYPDATINWRDALTRKAPQQAGETYHYTFRIPVVWTVTYANKAERPSLTTSAQKENWLLAQEELQNALDQYGIPKNKYQWTFRKIIHTFDDGTKEPAIKAIGFCTILCVLQGLVAEEDGRIVPLEAEIDDPAFYSFYEPEA